MRRAAAHRRAIAWKCCFETRILAEAKLICLTDGYEGCGSMASLTSEAVRLHALLVQESTTPFPYHGRACQVETADGGFPMQTDREIHPIG